MSRTQRQYPHKNEQYVGYWELFVSSKELKFIRSQGNRAKQGGFCEDGLEISRKLSRHKCPVVEADGIRVKYISTVSIKQFVTRERFESVRHVGADSFDWRKKSLSVIPQKQKIVIDIGKDLLNRVRTHFCCVCPLVEFRKFASSEDRSGPSRQSR
jgi:hypothetical protein